MIKAFNKFPDGSTRFVLFFLLAFLFLCQTASPQVVNEKTKKRVSIGFSLYQDFWLNMPSGLKTRTINQGANIFATYNILFGKSNFSFAIGLGLSTHNLYGNFLVNSSADSTYLDKIPDSISYKRSKITLAYLEIPLEFRYKSKSKVSVGLGFKGGFMIGSFWKYVGDGGITTYNFSVPEDAGKTRIKLNGLKNLEQFVFGPTLRVGYRWFNLSGYYMISTIFNKSHGPDMYPISVGITLMPF
ncbi:MAG TPA: outer membrane beta-barrel protein [Bacteroidales bacterium]|nr:outer membrane beta-barrel protein [Bacteroidales bacterium]